MTPPQADLPAFATALADRLPGTWTCDYQRHTQYADQFPRTAQLWDTGHVEHLVSRYVLNHDAVLHGPADQRLYVTERPGWPHQFVIAPLTPARPDIEPHRYDAITEPHGIAVPKDPARAAARVIRRLLPRYEQALQTVLANTADLPGGIQPAAAPHTARRTPPPDQGTGRVGAVTSQNPPVRGTPAPANPPVGTRSRMR
ncbi:hypothetical protein ACFC0S_00235 [Streptomyces sp. NPDC056084]|uniref:hypothetical protein n=1 Tax=unclassified Streptomyces TaxID=2593676 RepID=UPI0035DC7288